MNVSSSVVQECHSTSWAVYFVGSCEEQLQDSATEFDPGLNWLSMSAPHQENEQ